MKRTLLILVFGLLVGTSAHVIYFRLHQPYAVNTLDGQLAWMKSELQLSDAQYTRIKELHEASSPRLRALAAQVAQMQSEFTAFEQARRTADHVDFIEFAQFVETRRAIAEQCRQSTEQLVLASASVLNAQQREHYLGLVAATQSSGNHTAN
jgi:uncharacterized membrane protein